MSEATDRRILLLDERDNVFVVCQQLQDGESLQTQQGELVLKQAVNVGHKIAATDITVGSSIIKYGVSIGSSRTAIARGEHVHLHNMKSDYMPSYIRSGKINDGDAQ